MKLVLLLVLSVSVLATWQNGYYSVVERDGFGSDEYPALWGSVRDNNFYEMIVENPDKSAESYGTVIVSMPKPINYFGIVSEAPLDLDEQYKGSRWSFEMTSIY